MGDEQVSTEAGSPERTIPARPGARLLRVGLVHAVLVAVMIGAAALWGSGADPTLDARRVSLPDPDPRTPVVAASRALVYPPGTVVLDSTRSKSGESPVSALPRQEAAVLAPAGVVGVKALVTRGAGLTRGVWQMSVEDGSDPRRALRKIDDLYASAGFQLDRAAFPGLLIRMRQNPDAVEWKSVYRAHYVHGPHLIRIEAYTSDPRRAARAFADLAGRQLIAWPAT